MFNKIPGRAYLLIAILILAVSNSVIRRLTELGAANLIDGRNPISFCNVLLVGNLCALGALIAIYGREWNPSSLSRLALSDWLGLMVVALLSGALVPALFFYALENTAVNNVILIGRVEPPITLVLMVLILKAKVNKFIVIGAILAFVGVILTILLQPPDIEASGFSLGQGELMTAIAAIAASISGIISKIKLKNIPLGIFTIFRTAVGTVIFLSLTLKLYGISHFMDVFAPIVWQWMAIYGVFIVVGGQLAWLRGLKTSTAADVSLASSISPIAGILAAFLILGEAPTMAHYIGGGVILIGIICNQIGSIRLNKVISKQELANKMNQQVGFKGI